MRLIVVTYCMRASHTVSPLTSFAKFVDGDAAIKIELFGRLFPIATPTIKCGHPRTPPNSELNIPTKYGHPRTPANWKGPHGIQGVESARRRCVRQRHDGVILVEHADELLNRKKWKTRLELTNAIFDYVEVFYNRQRRHSPLDYVSPVEFEPSIKEEKTS